MSEIKTQKDFINSDNLKAQKEAGITRKLVGFEMLERGIPRHDYLIVDAEGKEIGIVTSGTMSPSLNKGIGMGYVPKELSKPDSEIYIQVRKKQLKAKVVKMPFQLITVRPNPKAKLIIVTIIYLTIIFFCYSFTIERGGENIWNGNIFFP